VAYFKHNLTPRRRADRVVHRKLPNNNRERFVKITSTIFQKFPSCVPTNISTRGCHNLAFAKYLDFKFSDV
jgi:hypothetical protein